MNISSAIQKVRRASEAAAVGAVAVDGYAEGGKVELETDRQAAGWRLNEANNGVEFCTKTELNVIRGRGRTNNEAGGGIIPTQNQAMESDFQIIVWNNNYMSW